MDKVARDELQTDTVTSERDEKQRRSMNKPALIVSVNIWNVPHYFKDIIYPRETRS
jgi:hypothetical protein